MQKITTLPESLQEEILAAVNQRIDQYTQTTVDKEWGCYNDIYRNTNRVLKTLEVNPGQRLSLQSHNNRMEVWIVESGRGQIWRGWNENEITIEDLNVGDVVVIQPEQLHRLCNIGKNKLIVLELQYGLCEESDCKKYQDDYGRN